MIIALKQSVITNSGEDMGRKEVFYTDDGNYNHSGNQCGDTEKKKKKLKIEIPYDPIIPLLFMFSKKVKLSILQEYMHIHVYRSTVHYR